MYATTQYTPVIIMVNRMGLIQKYLLPHEIDFDQALRKQAEASRALINDLYQYCINKNPVSLSSILTNTHQNRKLKKQNMRNLLRVLITPYDKESIYRTIMELDWIAISAKHLASELHAYKITDTEIYEPVFLKLLSMADQLTQGFRLLSEKEDDKINHAMEVIHDNYDETAELCAKITAGLLQKTEDIKHYLVHKEIFSQLKEIARRIHVAANTLEDMTIKIV